MMLEKLKNYLMQNLADISSIEDAFSNNSDALLSLINILHVGLISTSLAKVFIKSKISHFSNS